MSGGCRDCTICTRSPIINFLLFPIKIIFGWNIGLLIGFASRNCPECGHKLTKHERREDGSFKD